MHKIKIWRQKCPSWTHVHVSDETRNGQLDCFSVTHSDEAICVTVFNLIFLLMRSLTVSRLFALFLSPSLSSNEMQDLLDGEDLRNSVGLIKWTFVSMNASLIENVIEKYYFASAHIQCSPGIASHEQTQTRYTRVRDNFDPFAIMLNQQHSSSSWKKLNLFAKITTSPQSQTHTHIFAARNARVKCVLLLRFNSCEEGRHKRWNFPLFIVIGVECVCTSYWEDIDVCQPPDERVKKPH